MTTIPFFYINLEKDHSRKDNLEREFQRLGLSGNRLSAVWWNDLSNTAQAQLYSPELNAKQYYQPLVNGEKGCYTSHIHAWQALLDSTHACAVVLEDDVRLSDELLPTVQAVTDLAQNWDMVKLMGRPQEKISASTPLTATHALIQYTRVPSFTAGYVISRAGAAKLLASRVPFGRPIDIDLRFWWENDLHIYGVYPSVVLLDDSSQESTIAGRDGKRSLSTRVRKLQMKLQLTLGNLRYRKVRPWPRKTNLPT